MASKRLKWIYKMILVTAFLFFLATFKEWSYLLNPIVLNRRDIQRRYEFMKSTTNDKTVGKRTKFWDYHVADHKKTSRSKAQSRIKLSAKNSNEMVGSIYGLNCPLNPHKHTLKYLFNYWMTLDKYYNFSSFLCGGSLIGSLRDGDLIPYDRDIDVCVTLENYQKVRAIRSHKPFHHRSSLVYLAVQEDFFNNDASNRIRVNCKGRIVQNARDPCSFDTPGARLISRGVYVDVFVFREHGRNLRDHEYDKDHLKKDVFPLKDCTFMGVETKCPRNEMALLLKYYEPDVLTKPHYKCKNKTWFATSHDATKQFGIWFDKGLKRLYSMYS